MNKPWTERDVKALIDGYSRGCSVKEIALRLGRTKGAVRNQASKIGCTTRDDAWTDIELLELREAYSRPYKGEIDVAGLAAKFGRKKAAISSKARTLGLTNRKRRARPDPDKKQARRKYETKEERAAALSERMKRQHAERPHPMKGKKHTEDARKKISKASRRFWDSENGSRTKQQCSDRLSMMIAKNGIPKRDGASWKSGWREIGGQRVYFRSRWEANYARYLEKMRAQGKIDKWEFEPETFWFDAIKRGVRSYKPDFRITYPDGCTELHEVKGWMDARSKTALKRMAKYHPDQTVVLITAKELGPIAKKHGPTLPEWELNNKGGFL